MIAISGKDRGAILPAASPVSPTCHGHRSVRIDDLYMGRAPQWVVDFQPQAGGLVTSAASGRHCSTTRRTRSRFPTIRSGIEGIEAAEEIGEGLNRTGRVLRALMPSPFADERTLDFARAAIAGEGLGKDDIPDICRSACRATTTSITPTAESKISQDHLLQVDACSRLSSATSTRPWGGTTTSSCSPPTTVSCRPLITARASAATRASRTERSAREPQCGTLAQIRDGKWAIALSAQGVVVDRKLLEQKVIDRAAFYEEERVGSFGRAGFEVVYTRTELESGSRAGAPLFDAVRKTWYSERSPDPCHLR